ncbi:ribonuclease H-like domain-containing protein [Lasiosphaeria miniovina]|uniref:Ribonuclease H-like domain-containing protein n=1 Tax=Lasiosphaeria miniovina TaxID=1954250 RepID=A0AA40AD12_9PEZI|nr:ribonuclease H-like domain-containing protein [Lasiosphaeria miniovina]KAK0713514.1 ribonuclease H-like domain-containing protein [Lasiosphaeria miniovina]
MGDLSISNPNVEKKGTGDKADNGNDKPPGINQVQHQRATQSSASAPANTTKNPTGDASKGTEEIKNKTRKITEDRDLPQRPHYSAQGNEVKLLANFVEIKPEKDKLLYWYNLKIARNVDKEKGLPSGKKMSYLIPLIIRRNEVLRRGYEDGTLVTDFKATIISTVKLEIDEFEIKIPRPAGFDQETCTVSLETPNQKDGGVSEPLEVSKLLQYLRCTDRDQAPNIEKSHFAQGFNIWLRHFSKSYQFDSGTDSRPILGSGQVVVGSKAYPMNVTSQLENHITAELRSGVTAIRGYFSSVRLAENRLLVNINVSHGAFYKPGKFTDLLPNPLSGQLLQALHNCYKGARVDLEDFGRRDEHGRSLPFIKVIAGLAAPDDGVPKTNKERDEPYPEKRPRRVDGSELIGGDRCCHLQFWREDRDSPGGGFYQTVSDYFTEKNAERQKKGLPAFKFRKDDLAVNLGKRANPMYYPASFCTVLPGQSYKLKLNPHQTTAMLNFAVLLPARSVECILKDGLEIIGLARRSPSKLLFAPKRQSDFLNSGEQLITVDGRQLRFPRISYGGKGDHSFNAKNAAWNLFDARLLYTNPTQMPPWGIMFFFIMLNTQDSVFYQELKTHFETQSGTRGVYTVCMVKDKVPREGDANKLAQFLDNIMLKVNLKLGGSNHSVGFTGDQIVKQGNTMIVGLDVTHPPPGSAETVPSVAGMVASMDKNLGQWPATFSLQGNREEEVTAESFRLLIGPHLVRWRGPKKGGKYPENIIVYRDGVSEGQYNHVLKEFHFLKIACENEYRKIGTKSPRITIVVVGKRHHTRFFPINQASGDRNGNPMPGTLVDRGVTSQFIWEFYLQAHKALKGTARPAHYVVVVDEIFRGLDMNGPVFQGTGLRGPGDVLENLTHALSYMLGRSTTATAVCAPVLFADKACNRARAYLNCLIKIPANQRQAIGPDSIRVVAPMGDKMFYI